MKYRSRTDITAQILEAANGGCTKAKIMYRTFLSYMQLRQYLVMLVENGLLEYDGAAQTYKTTDKGHRFIQAYNKIGEFIAPRQERRGRQYQSVQNKIKTATLSNHSVSFWIAEDYNPRK